MYIAVGTELRHTMAWQTANSMISLLCAFRNWPILAYVAELVTVFKHICGKNARQQLLSNVSVTVSRAVSLLTLSSYTLILTARRPSSNVRILFFSMFSSVLGTFRTALKFNFVLLFGKPLTPLKTCELYINSSAYTCFNISKISGFSFLPPSPSTFEQKLHRDSLYRVFSTLFRYELSKHCFS
jgi:hypothetical protein